MSFNDMKVEVFSKLEDIFFDKINSIDLLYNIDLIDKDKDFVSNLNSFCLNSFAYSSDLDNLINMFSVNLLGLFNYYFLAFKKEV